MTESKICTCPSGDGSLVHPCPAHPAVEQAGANVGHGHVLPRADGVKMRCGGPGLCSECTADASRARAALAQPSTAQTQPSPAPTLRAAIDVANDRFEVPVAKWGTDLVGEEERPEVAEVAFVLRNIGAMDAEDIDGDNVDLRVEDAEGRDTGCDVSIVEYAEKAADLFEQHDRIVGALRAEIAMLRSYESEWELLLNEHEQQRDAAMARVAELEAKLVRVTELERQEPVSTEHLPMHIAYARAKREVFLGACQEDVFRFALIDLLQEFPLYAAPVAQAQHSVPEGWRIERSAERIVVMNLKNGAGYAAARDGESGIAESVLYLLAADLLAAAPGKEVGHE
ncbi:UNVERIFIED_CONTAM: hypothetical protein P3E15_28000 [Pseudomonas aeruginosa]|uniref:hypothetical protein n=1 Tax=Pseudomonas TaxID=286 RepID=UPI002157228F|nr:MULTISPECIES: hypothetical protein [unclassified Pseudomonas]